MHTSRPTAVSRLGGPVCLTDDESSKTAVGKRMLTAAEKDVVTKQSRAGRDCSGSSPLGEGRTVDWLKGAPDVHHLGPLTNISTKLPPEEILLLSPDEDEGLAR